MEEFKELNGKLVLGSGAPAPASLTGDLDYLSYYARSIAALFSRGGGFNSAGFVEDGAQLAFRVDSTGSIRGVRTDRPNGWGKVLHSLGV